MKCSCLTLVMFLVAVDAPGQSVGTVFRTAVDLVALNVVVTDPHQKFVAGLSSADFSVFEDGVRQDVSYFAAGDVPLDMAILLDTSASMSERMAIVHKAAERFVATLRPGDRVMVVDIKDTTRVLHALSPDIKGAVSAIQGTQASGGTALYNALYVTFKELMKAHHNSADEMRRQAIVVLSDGRDTASLMSFDDVMDVAKRSGIAAYTITVQPRLARRLEDGSGGTRILSAWEFAMKTLAQETGARPFFPLDIRELDGVYGSIATELASQYAIAYTPKNTRQDGAFRRVVVQVSDRPGVQTRTRSGYLSARPARTGALE